MELNFDKYSAREILDIYIKEGDRLPLPQAEYLLKRAIEKDPFYEEPYIHLSKVYRKLKKFDKAKEILNILKMLNPYRSYSYIHLAKLYAEEGDIEKAIDILKEGIKKFEEVNLSQDIILDLYILAIKYSIYNWMDEDASKLIEELYIKYKDSIEALLRVLPYMEELGLYELIYEWVNYLEQKYSLREIPLNILESYANACFETENDKKALEVYEYLKDYLEYPLKKFETETTLKLRFDYATLFLDLKEYKKVEKLMKAVLDLNGFGDHALAALELLKEIYVNNGKILKFLKILEDKVFGKYNLNSYYIEMILDILKKAYKEGFIKEALKGFGGLLASVYSYENKKLIEAQIDTLFSKEEKYLIELYKLHFEGNIIVED